MQKINLQLFGGNLKKVNPYLDIEQNWSGSVKPTYSDVKVNTSLLPSNQSTTQRTYSGSYMGNTNEMTNALNKNGIQMMNAGQKAAPSIKPSPGSTAYTVGKSVKDLLNLYSGAFGSYGGGGSIGRIGGFKASQAYNDAMAYTNSLLQQLNSGRTSYSDKISEMMAKIEGRDKFSYDFNTDPLFQNALASAMQSGQTAMQDTIGQASALTGGYGSSYATSAANQAYNSYIQDAYSQLPQYYNLALQAYQNEGQELYNQLGMYQTADATEYDRLANAYNANLSNAQNMYSQEYSNYWDTANYNLGVDKFNAQQKLDQQKMLYSLYGDALKNASKTTKANGTTTDGSEPLASFLTATNNDDTLDMLKNYYLQGGSIKDENSEYSKALDTLYLQGYDVDELDRWVRSQTVTAEGAKPYLWQTGLVSQIADGGKYYNVTYPDGTTKRVSARELEKIRKKGTSVRIN